jgi:hypothetical protein
MSSIHYFQRYSQPENVATNNTLLLLSRLYHHSPTKFEAFLTDLLEDTDLEAGIQFNQQRRGRASIPDAAISQVSFKVLIETKLHKHFSIQQLTEHLHSFANEQYQVLLSLSPHLPNKSVIQQVNSAITDYNSGNAKSVKYVATTFQQIVNKFRTVVNEYDVELLEMLKDYEEYCINDGLIYDNDSWMRVVTCGWTLNENFQYNLYYHRAGTGYSDHSYVGIYSQKSVVGVGKLENIVAADLIDDAIQVVDSTAPVTTRQQQNIQQAMAAARENNGWDIKVGHRFFCVEEFIQTDFKKNTRGPLQGTKFFNLKDLLGLQKLPDTREIATLLNGVTW